MRRRMVVLVAVVGFLVAADVALSVPVVRQHMAVKPMAVVRYCLASGGFLPCRNIADLNFDI